MLKVGFLVNPIAGIGGTVALKGSDDVAARAQRLGGTPRGPQRAQRALAAAGKCVQRCTWFTWGAAMGADYLEALNIQATVLGESAAVSAGADTRLAARACVAAGVDLLLFAGGDGTARDILESIGDSVPVLGIPAGVKMHSGVFATTPERAGGLFERLVDGGLVQSVKRDVRDLDETALRAGELKPAYFGELKVPEYGGYLQHTKEGGRENETLALQEIVADVVERLAQESRPVVLGPGGTLREIKVALGMQATLLGFDVWRDKRQQGRDVTARWLESKVLDPVVVLSFSRRQGFLIGRGNQQLSPGFLRGIQRRALWIVGTRSKLASLDGRPLLVDTDDAALDRSLCGLYEIVTGYDDRLWYRVDFRA